MHPKVLVRLGNPRDTDGITITEGVVLRKLDNGYAYAIATPHGVCIAIIKPGKTEGKNYYYSTTCFPVSKENLQYANYIMSHGVEINDVLFEKIAATSVLQNNISSIDEMLVLIEKKLLEEK